MGHTSHIATATTANAKRFRFRAALASVVLIPLLFSRLSSPANAAGELTVPDNPQHYK